MQNKRAISFIITGGTIDSYYDSTKDTAVPREHSILPSYIKSLRLQDGIEYNEVCMKDSRGITQEDRAQILDTIKKSSCRYFLVTHGTYTMPDTAKYLETGLIGGGDKTIILTGSMIPLEGFSPSDAGFNLGYAIAQFGVVSPGVYVAMNGQTFSPQEVIKLLAEGRFSSIFAQDK